ncbi:homocysteine S-methyltransferase family protein [Ruegeria hyattellae]|uniref:homocysteine S-methyltransferase family protein n=1 Tax=Ruegeria hyattellae TaxID=3233337 RepID=UPI00355BF9B3
MSAKYRDRLPQLLGKQCLSDGGLETHLIFNEGYDLPMFAAFTLLQEEAGRQALDRYMRRFAKIALRDGRGLILDTPTWRASARWAKDIEISVDTLARLHCEAVERLHDLRTELETPASPFVVNGVIGPQDDGYNPQTFMNRNVAQIYHGQQVDWFAALDVDMVSAITMTYADEAIGITNACADVQIPVVISFTVETDGRLPSGQRLGEAIEQVDAEAVLAPAYYMINCAHPDHFADVLTGNPAWLSRVMGIRANASRMSHEELDAAEELDEGNPQELGGHYRQLAGILPNLTVMGGCCGTDHRHIDEISKACLHADATAA